MARTWRRFSRVSRDERVTLGDLQVQLAQRVGLAPPLRRPGDLLQLDAADRGRRRFAGVQVGHLEGKQEMEMNSQTCTAGWDLRFESF